MFQGGNGGQSGLRWILRWGDLISDGDQNMCHKHVSSPTSEVFLKKSYLILKVRINVSMCSFNE